MSKSVVITSATRTAVGSLGKTLKNKTYQVYFFGGAIELYEGSSKEEIDEYLEDNWKEITDNLSWNIEIEIEEV